MIKKLLIAIGCVTALVGASVLMVMGMVHVPIFTTIVGFGLLVLVVYDAQGDEE